MLRHEPDADERREATVGVACGLGAYAMWGFVVVYFKSVQHVPALSVVAHRALWSLPLIFALILLTGGRPRLRRLLADRRTLLLLPASAALIGVNWCLFVYCTVTGRVLHAALAYYLTPIVMTGLGAIVLGEPVRRLQLASVGVAACGVAAMAWAAGGLPWASLAIAGSWSLYSLIRRARRVPSAEGLSVELVLIAPVAAAWLIWFAPPTDAGDLGLLAVGGVVTVAPLVLFGLAATRLSLGTLGFMQYLGPSIQFVLGVAVYGEAFGLGRQIAFGLTWLALGLFTFDAVRHRRAKRRGPPAAVPVTSPHGERTPARA